MDIPDEAIDAGISAMHTLPEVSWRYEGATAAIEAAAPHIARSAQVAILGKLSDLLLAQRDKLAGNERWRGRRGGLEEAAGMARSMAKTLEAGDV